MLTDKQSLILSGIIVAGFVITGLLDILDNVIVIIVLVVPFIIIVINLFTTKRIPEADEEQQIKAQAKDSNL